MLQDTPDAPRTSQIPSARTPQTALGRPRRAPGRSRTRPTRLQEALDACQDASDDAQVSANHVFSRASEAIFDRPWPEFVTEIVIEFVIEIVTETCDRAN